MMMIIIMAMIIVVVVMALIPFLAFPPTMAVVVAIPMPTGRHMTRRGRTMRRLDIGWRLPFHVFPGECPLRNR
ncbi:hypothetical protein RM96_21605 [Cupriavidus sp. IDO]|nr:hypothetical protein RM96_21605 [Cupriavidus sp. IDO]